MTCLGVLERGERGDDNETSLKEGGGIEMSTTVLSIYAMHALFAEYLPCHGVLQQFGTFSFLQYSNVALM